MVLRMTRSPGRVSEMSATAGVPTLSHSGSAIDILTAILLVAGMAALVLGLFRRQEEKRERDFTIGPDPKATYNAPGELLPAPLFPLLQPLTTVSRPVRRRDKWEKSVVANF